MWEIIEKLIGGIVAGGCSIGIWALTQAFIKGKKAELLKQLETNLNKLHTEHDQYIAGQHDRDKKMMDLVNMANTKISAQAERLDSISRDSLKTLNMIDGLEDEVKGIGKSVAGLHGTIDGLRALLQYIAKDSKQ